MISTIEYTLLNLNTLLLREQLLIQKEKVLLKTKLLVDFLMINNMITINPYTPEGHLRDDLILTTHNVTTQGLHLFMTGVKEWNAYIEQGGNPENIQHLENSLPFVLQ